MRRLIAILCLVLYVEFAFADALPQPPSCTGGTQVNMCQLPALTWKVRRVIINGIEQKPDTSGYLELLYPIPHPLSNGSSYREQTSSFLTRFASEEMYGYSSKGTDLTAVQFLYIMLKRPK